MHVLYVVSWVVSRIFSAAKRRQHELDSLGINGNCSMREECRRPGSGNADLIHISTWRFTGKADYTFKVDYSSSGFVCQKHYIVTFPCLSYIAKR